MDTTAREKICSLIYEALHNVYDPELGVNVIDLGLTYRIEVIARFTWYGTLPGSRRV